MNGGLMRTAHDRLRERMIERPVDAFGPHADRPTMRTASIISRPPAPTAMIDMDPRVDVLDEDRMTPISVTCSPEEGTRTANSPCVWVAEAMVDGRTYTAHSRHSAPNELARQLVAAGLTDRPMVIRYRGRAGTMTWHSFHAAAAWTYSEGDQPLRRVRYKERPEGLFLGSGTGKKCVSSPAYGTLEGAAADIAKNGGPPYVEMRFSRPGDRRKCVSSPTPDVLPPPADGREIEVPAAGVRRCDGCDGDFVPARRWSRFCSPVCRLRAHRGLALRGETNDQPQLPSRAPKIASADTAGFPK
jgi:hypothetical protein